MFQKFDLVPSFDLFGDVLGAGASIFGSVENAQNVAATNAANMQIAQYNDTFSAEQAGIQRAFQTQMSDTAVTRATQDMKNAGINPLLAAGAPASTPSGAMATPSTPQLTPVPSIVNGIISNAKDLIGTYASVKSAIANADLAKANTVKAGVDTTMDQTQTQLNQKKMNEASLESNIFGLLNRMVGAVSSSASSLYQNLSGNQNTNSAKADDDGSVPLNVPGITPVGTGGASVYDPSDGTGR